MHRSNVFFYYFFAPGPPKPSRNRPETARVQNRYLSKGFQLKIDGFSIPGRSRPRPVAPVEACGLCKELHLANVQLPIPISVTSEEHCTDEIRPHAITGCMCLVAVVEIMYNVVYAVVVAGRGKRERARARARARAPTRARARVLYITTLDRPPLRLLCCIHICAHMTSLI